MKALLDEWGVHIFVGIVIFGLGTGNIYQSISYTSKKLEEQIEYIDLMNFNQQIMNDNTKLLELNRKQTFQIQQMDIFIQQMYNRLRQHENLPPLPGQEKKPNKSEA